MSPQSPFRRAGSQSGFSLLEIMVGVVIGILGIVIIFQVISVFEGRKRTTGTGSDAQIAGNIAMFNVERELKLAGNGFGTSTFMGCTVAAYDSNNPAPSFNFPMIPIKITQGGNNPDTLVVLSGDANMLVSTKVFSAAPTIDSKKLQSSRSGLQMGELIIIAQDKNVCALAEVTDNNNPDTLTIAHQSNTAYTNYLNKAVTSRFNDPAGINITQGRINDLGLTPRLATWTVGIAATPGNNGSLNGKLIWKNDLSYVDVNPVDGKNDWFAVADGIVDLKAQYGVDAGCGAGAACSGVTTWTNVAPADWLQVVAVRIAVLARSQQYEKPVAAGSSVTNTPPEWSGGAFAMAYNADGATADGFAPGDPDPNNWRNYRYRVYQTIVPLRNVIWGGGSD